MASRHTHGASGRLPLSRAWFIGVYILFAAATPGLAQRLPGTAVPEHYDLSFEVDLAGAHFKGHEQIAVRIPSATTKVVLHALDLDLTNVVLSSGGAEQRATVSLNRTAQTATLTLARPIAAGPASIGLDFAGALGNDLRGFYLSRANGRRYAVTQFESTDARRAFPCFDEPSLKSTFSLSVTIDRSDTVISNGRMLSDTPDTSGSRHTLTFAKSPKMSSYLVAMAVGDFECLADSAEGIPIRICATPDKTPTGRIALDWAKQILTFYNRYYSIKYPFEKLDVVAVPDFAAGAMENTAAIFYRETSLLADASASRDTQKGIAGVLAHEMAHQWFGNLVTMAWWNDLWLNEGFATWMESRPLSALRPDWDIAVDEAEQTRGALNLDALRTTRAIRTRMETPDEIEGSFDTIAYSKGAAVMRMVEGYVGADAFRAGVNAYLERHQYGNATSSDFWTAMAAASGKPVDRILPTFVNQPGAPLVQASLDCRADRGHLVLQQRRFSLDAALLAKPDPARWLIPICIRESGQTGTSCHLMTGATLTVPLERPCSSGVVVNADALGYFRVAYSPSILSTLAPNLEVRMTAPERLALVSDEWALVRAGRHDIATYLNLVAGLRREFESGVLRDVAGKLAFIRNYLTSATTRPRFEAWVRDRFEPLFGEIERGGGPARAEDRSAVASILLGMLGSTGRDPKIAAAARARLDDALAQNVPLEPATADTIVGIAAQGGDEKLFESLQRAASTARVAAERYRYLFALGNFEDPQLVDRGLESARSSDLRSQDTAAYLVRFLDNAATNVRAWAFVKKNWAELEPKISVSFGTVRLAESLDSFCSTAARTDIRTFFANGKAGPAARAVDQTLERIGSCVAIRNAQTPVLTKWIEQTRPTRPDDSARTRAMGDPGRP